MLKNIILTLATIMICLCIGEIAVRITVTRFYSGAVNVFTSYGSWMNRSDGEAIAYNSTTGSFQYHFYWPGLRDTPFKNDGRIKIVTLGDSFTFGQNLPWKETFVYQLQQLQNQNPKWKHIIFLNAGAGGWGTADYLAYLEHYGHKISPQYVLIFINTDDIGRSLARNIYTLTDQKTLKLTTHFHPLPYIGLKNFLSLSTVNWIVERSKLLQLIKNCFSMSLEKTKNQLSKRVSIHVAEENGIAIPASPISLTKSQSAIKFGQALFLRLKQWCQTHHARLLIVTTGFNAFYPSKINDPTQQFLNHATFFFQKYNIPYHDLSKCLAYKSQGKNFTLPADHHPNQLGARLISDCAWPWIQKQLAE